MKIKNLISIIMLLVISGHQMLLANDAINAKSLMSIFDQLQEEQVEEVTISIPVDSLSLNKNTTKSFEGKFTYWDKQGIQIDKKIKVKARGKSRRRHCEFPPLRLSFSKKDLQHHGLRAKHSSLKLVTHCNYTETANDNVLKEYLTYKLYNEITENSLQVQLLKVRYVDIDSEKELVYYGFLLEDIDALAERIGGAELNTYGRMQADFEPSNIDQFSLFQFMIGNDDWQVPQRRNLKYIHREGKYDLLIPYDFDMTGLVAVEYARPNVSVGLKSVTQRLFMGDFMNSSRRSKAIKHFQSKRKDMYALIDDCKILSKSERRNMKNYLMSFYEIIGDPTLRERAFPIGDKSPEMTDEDGRMNII